MDTSLYARIQDLLSKNDKIAIAVGKNPSVDDMAAGLALYLGLVQMGKNVSIASSSEPLVEHSSLVGIDKVKSQFEGDGGDLIVSFPYREGEIEKVSYTIENNFLNIVVKAGQAGLQFKEQSIRYSRSGGVPQALFIVGTPRLADLGSLFNPEALKDTAIINIDNKADNQGFGDVVLVSKNASSVCEVIAELLSFLGVDIDVDAAQNLLSGIAEGTDNFQNPKTTYVAFELAASLMKKGATRKASFQPSDNEDRVSSFMPEQMLSTQGFRTPQRPQAMPSMPRPAQNQQQFSTPRPQPQSFPTPQRAPYMTPPTQQAPPVPPRPQPPMPQPQAQQPFPQQQPPAARPGASQPAQKPPSDWLTPKVYKGSSNIS